LEAFYFILKYAEHYCRYFVASPKRASLDLAKTAQKAAPKRA
jgi:hypothetical protein